MGVKTPQGEAENPAPGEQEPIKDVELLRVVVLREGQNVNAQWAIHPQLKHDLKPEEWTEVSELMKQITGVVGNHFSKVLTEADPDRPGNA